MSEQEWKLREEEDRPQDTKVVAVEIMSWYPSEAKATGFPDLLSGESEYTVVVGLNNDGNMVGAAKIERYIHYSGPKGIAHRRVLEEKGKKIFGLTGSSIPSFER